MRNMDVGRKVCSECRCVSEPAGAVPAGWSDCSCGCGLVLCEVCALLAFESVPDAVNTMRTVAQEIESKADGCAVPLFAAMEVYKAARAVERGTMDPNKGLGLLLRPDVSRFWLRADRRAAVTS